MIQVKTIQQSMNSEYALKAMHALNAKQCKGADMLGWMKIHPRPKMQKKSFEQVVVIGIGGSYLGTRAFYETFGADIPVRFLGYHMSTSATKEVLNQIQEKNTALVIVSKSGTTTEPALATRLALDAMKKGEAFVVTDAEKGALREIALKCNLHTEVIPDDVGGRFSVFSPVAMLPLELAGWDTQELLNKAQQSMKYYLEASSTNPCVQYASSRFDASAQKGCKVEVLAYHDPRLMYFAEWWKQLFGESEGKEHRGLFPASVCYSTDLHSMGQYMQDGQRILFESFLSYKEDPENKLLIPALAGSKDGFDHLVGKSLEFANMAAFEASRLAHTKGGVETLELKSASSLSKELMADWMCFFMVSCAISALMLEVNPFDQPGVEDYKKEMHELLRK
jgi:glucose-6-phosphate isomerase